MGLTGEPQGALIQAGDEGEMNLVGIQLKARAVRGAAEGSTDAAMDTGNEGTQLAGMTEGLTGETAA